MRRTLAILVLALPLAVLAQDKFKPDVKWQSGAKTKFSFAINFVMADATADVSGILASEAKEEAKLVQSYEKVKVVVNDQELDYPFEASNIVLDKSGFLKEITGGIEGGDTARIYLATQFVIPSEPLAKGETWKKQVAKNEGLKIGDLTYEATYAGAEKLGEADSHRYTTKLTESGNDFSAENTIWVDANGKVLKLEGKFKNMPVPAASTVADGKHKLEIVK